MKTPKSIPNAAMSQWDKDVESQTGWCHFLQSAEWAYIKSQTSWQAKQVELGVGKRQLPAVLYSRSTPGFGRIYYVPKLAALKPREVGDFTSELKQSARAGVAIRVEIDQPYSEELNKALLTANWLPSEAIQYPSTVLMDLDRSSEELFQSFKKRARWEISAAKRRGVTAEKVECSPENLQLFFDMLNVTSKRGNFRIRGQEFSNTYWKLLGEQGIGSLYMAKHEDDILSMAYVITIGNRAYYKDGASVRQKSNMFASRYMQWTIMQDLQEQGCNTYDLCGVPLPDEVSVISKGIYLFKTGFGEGIHLQGSYTLPLRVKRHKAWSRLEPILVKLYLKLFKDLWY